MKDILFPLCCGFRIIYDLPTDFELRLANQDNKDGWRVGFHSRIDDLHQDRYNVIVLLTRDQLELFGDGGEQVAEIPSVADGTKYLLIWPATDDYTVDHITVPLDVLG